MEAVGIGFLVTLFVGLWVALLVFWILAIVEVVKLPEHQFRAAGTEKTTWILIVAIVGVIGAVIWRLAKRKDVLAAEGWRPVPPPGWYPSPDGAGLQWWNGGGWTADRQPPRGPQGEGQQ